jgi:Immunoglobulin-like domain of bacterial spore germination/Sporulation and spore germination
MHAHPTRHRLAMLAWIALVGALVGGCTAEVSSAASRSGEERAADAPAAAPARGFTAPPAGLEGRAVVQHIYYLRTVGTDRYLVPERHQVRLGSSLPESAVRELLAGTPVYPGSTRPFPAGTRLLGFRLDGATALVDLSREAVQVPGGAEAARLSVQALVWTVTKAADVRRVLVKVEGRTSGEVDGRPLGDLWGPRASPDGLTRDDGVRLAPIALLEPVPGARVDGARVVVRGEACVAHGVVSLRLRDREGTVAAQGFTSSDAAPPVRAPFSGSLAFDPPAREEDWTLEVFEASPADGSVRYSVELPVRVGG